MELGYTREIYLKSLRGTVLQKSQLFKVTNKGKPPRVFSLVCKLTKNNVEFLPIVISSKKVPANNVDFSTREITSKKMRGSSVDFSTIDITSKKVRGKNVDISTSKITPKKVRGNNVDFSTIQITSVKYVEMAWKFVEIWTLTYRRNTDVESTSIRLDVPVGKYYFSELCFELKNSKKRIWM